ncbi:MAG: NUDIX hydrolase [Immundisolibacter sp.]|uniref:NUDIX hydrolase n=1 Tax=Immundisolibacter sp. TaxID=1934948 RepID=UPI0019A236E3|nr:NUDIX hydrolase [Immundisolibacter sp.]MBC7162131.1 NUDIX hydrolase [Immundisolibacter sp.]
MIWTPRVTVAAIVERDGRFLLVEELAEGRLVLNQPAGHLEHGESLIDACRRETLEETGWKVEPESVVGLYRRVEPTSGITTLRVCFSARPVEHYPDQPLDTGIERAVWLDREALAACADRHRTELVLRCLDDYLAGARHPLALLAHA